MTARSESTVVTERGQTSIPAEIRRALDVEPGDRLVWEVVSPNELRVRLLRSSAQVDPIAMLGFARRFRATRRTVDWMAELREGEP